MTTPAAPPRLTLAEVERATQNGNKFFARLAAEYLATMKEAEEMREALRRIASYPDANPISDAHYIVRKEAQALLDRLDAGKVGAPI